MNLRDLYLRVRALVVPRRVDRELDEELAFHIERETQKHIAAGLNPADARIRARVRFGSVPLAADECRDARGTAFFDTLAQDIRYAFRTFRRAPLAALTIVTTVALGLGLVAVVFTFYSAFFLRADAVRNPGELFQVRQPPYPGNTRVWEVWTRPNYDALRRETSVFTDAFAMLQGVETRVDGRSVSGTLVTGNFFQVLGVNATLGRILLPDDDQKFAGRPVVVLSHAGWTRLFADDPNAIGRSIIINGTPYTLVGIMPPGFHGLAASPPDYWAPLDLLGQFRPALAGKEDHVAITVVGRLKPALSSETATTALTAWASANPTLPSTNGPKTIFLMPSEAPSADLLEGLRAFAPLFCAFGLILMIGCANVANLLLARGVSRQREVGVRLSLGASRRRIIRQLLTESLLLALAAAACGLGVSRLILQAGAYAAGATMPPEMAERVSLAAFGADWRVVVFLLFGAVASTVFFGLAPALQATRLELVRTMRGEVTRDARPGRARHALVAIQVGASTMLVISAAVFLRSAFAAASVKPVLRTADTVLLEMGNEALRPAMLQAVIADPSVAAVAASWPRGLRGENADALLAPGERPAVTSAGATVEYRFVSPEYFALLGIDVLGGRGFSKVERTTDAGIVVVSQSVARRLWPGHDAIGQIVRLDAVRHGRVLQLNSEAAAPQLPFRDFTVVGVVRDARVDAGLFGDPTVYLPVSPEAAGTSLVLRVHGDPDQARRQLIERLTKVDPAMGAVTTLRSILARTAYVLQAAFWLTAVLAGLALMLTLSGLFSVLSYLVEQRSKEIGVRMALGATTRHIGGLVFSQSVGPVVFGLIAGGGLAGLLAKVLVTTIVATTAAARAGRLVRIFDPVAYGVSPVVIIVACALAASVPAWRAARIDPIATLRND